MTLFDRVGELAGKTVAQATDEALQHFGHVMAEKLDSDCDRCVHPEKYIVRVPNYDWENLVELW